MTKQEKQDYIMYIQTIYDELLEKEEHRNISYGELAYIQDLNKKGLEKLETEILEKLEKYNEEDQEQ